MTKRVQAKVQEPLTIPFAISHIKDEHMIGKPQEVYNREITGFIVTAEVLGKTYCTSQGLAETDIETFSVQDLQHYGDEVRIFCDDNIMNGDLWLKMILAIPKNMEAITKAVERAYEEQNLQTGNFILLTTDKWFKTNTSEYLN